jgi:hypothetical protein
MACIRKLYLPSPQVLTVMLVKIQVLDYQMVNSQPTDVLRGGERVSLFRAKQSRKSDCLTPKMGALRYTETSVIIYYSIWRKIAKAPKLLLTFSLESLCQNIILFLHVCCSPGFTHLHSSMSWTQQLLLRWPSCWSNAACWSLCISCIRQEAENFPTRQCFFACGQVITTRSLLTSG